MKHIIHLSRWIPIINHILFRNCLRKPKKKKNYLTVL